MPAPNSDSIPAGTAKSRTPHPHSWPRRSLSSLSLETSAVAAVIMTIPCFIMKVNKESGPLHLAALLLCVTVRRRLTSENCTDTSFVIRTFRYLIIFRTTKYVRTILSFLMSFTVFFFFSEMSKMLTASSTRTEPRRGDVLYSTYVNSISHGVIRKYPTGVRHIRIRKEKEK